MSAIKGTGCLALICMCKAFQVSLISVPSCVGSQERTHSAVCG